jgi:hypothetical protein
MYVYLFTIDYTADGLSLREFVDASPLADKTYHEQTMANAVAVRMGLDKPHMPGLESLERAVNLMYTGISARFSNGGSVYQVRSERPISADVMHTLLRTRQQRGTLSNFLEEARVA